MIETLQQLDSDLLLALNGLHADWLDQLMYTLSGKWIWVPFYVMLLYFVWRRNRKLTPTADVRRTVLCLACIALAITAADQLCATVLRPIFERPRPANIDSPIQALVHIVNDYRGGHYGFPSCHAANSFALAAFMIMFFKNNLARFGMIFWAVTLCYTRIYLGVHYPGDLLVGALIGSMCGFAFYAVYRNLCRVRPAEVPFLGRMVKN